MQNDKARPKLMFALGVAILLGVSLLLVLNASGRVFAVEPPLPPQGPVGWLAPTRPPPLKPPPPRTGFIPPPVDLSHLKGDKMPEGVRVAALPSRWDWRDQGTVTSVKNQGACESCYAFAAIGNFESKMLIDGAGSYDFSENNAKECNWQELNNYQYPPGSPFGSCDGGNYLMLASLFSQKGTVLESCDPYVPSNIDCKDTCPYIKTLLDWRIISGDAVPDTEVLKSYIRNYGPVYTSMYAGDRDAWDTEFGNYDGSYTLYYPETEEPNHAVLIIGWDDGLTHAGGMGGWIAKNSWGTDWGDNGYFTIAYGSASIGMHSSFIYDWQDYDPNSDIMYYDEAGWMGWSWGYEDTTGWGLCRFIPSSSTYVTRVEFWTTDTTTDVDVYIYDDFDGMALSNPLWSSLGHSFDEAGYHGVVVDPPLTVMAGDEVIAVVAFNNVSYQYPIPIDVDGPNEVLRTYVSPSGRDGSWYNLGAGEGKDVAIRLRTSGIAVPPTPTVTPTPPGFNKVYLPTILKNYIPGAPTPTPTPTPTITPMNTPGPNVGAAHGRILWNDEGASGAYSRLCQNLVSGTCSGRQYDTTTDASGWYEFTDVVPDSYCHLVRLAGEPVWWYKSFLFGCSEITISAGKVARIDDFHVPKTDLALLSPPDDSTLDTNQPTLVWAAYPAAAYYKVYLYRESPSPETILNYVRVDGTALTVQDPLYGGKYRWSVNAYNASDRRIAYSGRAYHFTVLGPPAPTPTPTPLPTPPPGTDVHVTNSTTFTLYAGSTSTYLVGEVYNASSVSVGFVKIYATFYDAGDNIVDEGYTYSCIHHLAPGMNSPFHISCYNLPASSWDHYELHLTWQTTAYTPLPMEVSNTSDFFDDWDAFHVTGDVRNQYDRRLSDIKACVAMHDAAGNTIGVGWDDVAALDPGETDSFGVEVYFWKYKPDRGEMADYSLQVYNQYE
ncbi:MAG: C1 family peptidase [Anaerolineae bacterium]